MTKSLRHNLFKKHKKKRDTEFRELMRETANCMESCIPFSKIKSWVKDIYSQPVYEKWCRAFQIEPEVEHDIRD